MASRRLKLADYAKRQATPLYAKVTSVQHRVPEHDHDFLEIAIIFQGTAEHHAAGQVMPVKRGDVVILRPGVWHAYQNSRKLLVGNCALGLAMRHRELAWTRHDPQLSDLLWAAPWTAQSEGIIQLALTNRSLTRVRRHLESLEADLAQAVPPHPARTLAHLLHLLSELADAWANQQRSAAVRADASPHPAVVDAVALIEQHYHLPLTLDDLAEQVDLDAAYLSRLFRADLGLPPMTYLNRLRMQRAAYRLLTTDRPISHIAAGVGMDDANYFTRRFSKYFGMTPSRYRDSHHLDG